MSADGTMLAIGAQFNDRNGINSGHVRVFTVNSTTQWEQVGQDIDGEAAYDQSGSSVSMSADGTMLAIGAVDKDGIVDELRFSVGCANVRDVMRSVFLQSSHGNPV